MPARLAVLTLTALVAFAANSVLARLALRSGAIDAASYTGIRLAAGAVAECVECGSGLVHAGIVSGYLR